MRKFVALCALVLTACAPAASASTSTSASEANRAIPVTYFPTLTPFPTWTPPSSPTPLPTLPPTATTLPTWTPEPTAQPIIAQAAPALPTATPELIALALPTLAPTETAIPPTATAIPLAQAPAPAPRAAFAAPSGCPASSANTYDLAPFDGPAYKNNALTDENPDLRLSVLGYTFSDAPLALVDYNGATDSDPPKLHGLFEPNRVPAFLASHRHYEWAWNEAGGPPYGSSSGVNGDWPASVIDFGATPGEAIYIPERGPVIWGNGIVAMVLYASERELTLAYTRQDSVTAGYVVHMLNLCVDANLVAQYRAQTSEGRRATSQLPGLRNNQMIGVALGPVTVAIRDRGAFLDPRSRKDWW